MMDNADSLLAWLLGIERTAKNLLAEVNELQARRIEQLEGGE